MDDDTPRSPTTPAVQAPGGAVEPANRARIAKERFQTPIEEPREPMKDVAKGNVVPMVDTKASAGPDKAAATADRPERPAAPPIDAKTDRETRLSQLEAALHERYVIKRAPLTVGETTIGKTEYRFRGDTSRVAFTESTFKLATDTNSPSVARSMVDVAEARNWKALRVSGNEDFKRLVWLEASVRGVKTIGYDPHPADLELLKREREARQVNRIEPTHDVDRGAGAAAGKAAAPAEKASGRGGGRKAVLAAVEAVLLDRKVPPQQREAVMAAAAEKLGQRTRAGQAPKVKVYDPAAPSQRPVPVPQPEQQRSRDRAAPVR